MLNITHALGAGRCTPLSDTTRVASAGRIECQKGQHHNSASDIGGSKAAEALCDCTLHVLADGGDQCSNAAPCLRAVGDLLRQIGGSL